MKKLQEQITQFFRGRYGIDNLNRFIFVVTCIVTFLRWFFSQNIWLLSAYTILLIIFLYRMFSKNYMQRYRENATYMNLQNPIVKNFKFVGHFVRDFPKFKYLKCQNCRTTIRIPRGKKTIMVTCPKCNNTFKAKS